MQEYHWAQDKMAEVTQTTAERRLKQMAAKREKEAKRASTNAPRKTEAYHCGDPYCGDCPEPHNDQGKGQTPQADVPLDPPVGREGD